MNGYPRHPDHELARRNLEDLVRNSRLPMTAEELMPWAYKIGGGDPWEGFKQIKTGPARRELDTADDPRAVLLSRLKKCAAGQDA